MKTRDMTTLPALLPALLLVPLLALAPAGTADAKERFKVGTLDCVIGPGSGAIFGSIKDLKCEFTPDSGQVEAYFGVVERFGLDIGSTGGSYVKWLVLASTPDGYRPGGLDGDYTGLSAEVTAGAGLGANALIGGGKNGIILQPLSIQGQEGINLAAGVTVFQLRSL